MWSESLKIRLGMTAAWLALAASLFFAAQFDPSMSSAISSAEAMETIPQPVAVVDHAVAPAAEDAG